ncbi:MAG: hypothetical protein P4L16_05625 [Chlamydiales bacterium]|nr:hypothetical protein [Chlamydiales bacterium]
MKRSVIRKKNTHKKIVKQPFKRRAFYSEEHITLEEWNSGTVFIRLEARDKRMGSDF